MLNEIWSLCVSKNYFTDGDNTQYTKMYDLIRAGCSARDVAVIIWVCSEGAELSVVEREVSAIFRRYGRR